MSDMASVPRFSRLLYTSRRRDPGHADAEGLDVEVLAASSTARNVPAGLTGCLLLVDGTFIQLLEGPAAAVEATFERICRDLRHTDLQLVDLAETAERLFPAWSMACLDADRAAEPEVRGCAQEVHYLMNINAAAAIRQMRDLFDRGGSLDGERLGNEQGWTLSALDSAARHAAHTAG